MANSPGKEVVCGLVESPQVKDDIFNNVKLALAASERTVHHGVNG